MLFCGSYSFLKENLKEIINNLERVEKLTFIVHTNQMKTYLKEYLAKELGILANAKFYTLVDISKSIVNIEPLQDFDKELILRKFLYEKGLKLDGLPEDFNLLVQQIKQYEIPIENIKSQLVKDIIKSYEEFKSNEYFDREDVHKLAIGKINKELLKTDFSLGYLFIFGIKSVPILFQKLFIKLKQVSKNTYVFLPIFSDSGYFQNYYHFSEVRNFFQDLAEGIKIENTNDKNILVSKKIYKFDYETIKNENIKLIKADIEIEEIEYIAEKILDLSEKGVDFYKIGIVIPHIENYLPFIKEIFKKYKIPYYLLEENKYIDDLIYRKLFSVFEIKLNNFSKESVLGILSNKLLNIKNIEEIEEKILLSPIIEGIDDYREYLFKENNFRDLKNLLELLNNLPEKAKLEEYIKVFTEINNNFIKDETAKNFLENILSTLEDTKLYQKLFEEIEYEDFVSIIKTFFLQENKEHKLKANTVSIITPTSAEANNFEYIFFVNLNSGNFPSTLKEEVLASSTELNGLDYPYHLLMQQILNFCSLLDKNKKIYLSYITNSIISGQKAPSVIVEEIKRILNIKEEVATPFYEKTVKDFKIKYANLLRNIDNSLKEKWETLQKSESPEIKDFKLENVEIEFPISPTKFSVYAYCPYKFFLEHIVKIEEPEEQDRTQISPLEKGILVHKILEKFYKGLDLNNYTKYLEEKIPQIKEEYYSKIEELIKPVLPSYKPFEYEKANTLYNHLIKFIKTDLQRLTKQQKEVPKELLEKEFEDENFKGRIDRIDKDKAGNYYIYDYKTGENPVKDIKEEIKNKYIQLLIYKNFLEKEGKIVKEIGIFAVNDKFGNFVYSIDDETTLKELKAYLENLIKNLKEKWFYPKENEFCNYCQFNDFCLKDKLPVEELE